MKSRWLNLIAIFAFLLTLPAVRVSTPSQPIPQASIPQASVPQTEPAPHAAMLQFTAGGHVLGFETSQVYLVAMDHALHIEFVGATGVRPLPDPSSTPGGSAMASPLTRVTYPELWDGISVTYQASAEGILESTYRLAAGADVKQIRLRFNVPVQLTSDGGLQFTFGNGWLSESAPLAWQEMNGTRVPVSAGFEIVPGTSLVTFRLGAYDPSQPLVIDPVYNWHTFYGGHNGSVQGKAVAVDGSGNTYVVGVTNVDWQGDNGANPLHALSGSYTNNIVVVKLNSSGAYQWHTFYGLASGRAVAVDGSGNVVVVGYSYGTWQGDGGANPLHAYSSSYDIFVLKLNSSGVYQWHTFYGGSGSDDGMAVATGPGGNILVTGQSNASWQGDGGVDPLHAYSGDNDIAVLKLDSSGAYLWHTFYGSASGADSGNAIAVDGNAAVYVTGESTANWQGDSSADPLHAISSSGDIVVLKLNRYGTYQWHTFYGGTGGDTGYAIALDGSSNAYITGGSSSSWQGDGGTNPLHAFLGGTGDIVALKLNSSGVYQWHTFYGGTGFDVGLSIAVDGSSNVYLSGYSSASWQGDGAASPLQAYSGSNDIMVLKLNSSGTYQWHTFHGSSGGNDYGYAIAVDGSANVYVAGASNANWGGTVGAGYPHHSYSGGSYNIMALKLNTSGNWVWHTFYGTPYGNDVGYAIGVDGSGNIYVAGTSDAFWQGDGQANPLHAFSGGGGDIVVVKLNSNGVYQWHTFYGSASAIDNGKAIAVDGSGNVYVAGDSLAPWLGNNLENPIHAYSGGDDRNIVVLKLSSNGTYQWHTFYGAAHSNHIGNAIAMDGSGDLYIAGYSTATWPGDSNTPPLHAYSGGGGDIVVLKLNLNGAYLWHTFYGSSNADLAYAIALDQSGNAYVTGSSYGSWLGDSNADPKHAYSGNNDIVVLKLNHSGAYQWHTFYGSTGGYDDGYAIAVDGLGNVVATGGSDAAWQGAGDANPLHAFVPGTDLVVLKLNSNGVYQWHTFYPSASVTGLGNGVAVDGIGNIYVADSSGATWQGDAGADPLHAYSGGDEIVVLNLNSSGAYQWHTFYGSSSSDIGYAIALDQTGNVYVTGFSDATWLGDHSTNPLHVLTGAADIVVLKLGTYKISLPLVSR
jgi:hypothetical protein